MFITNRAKIEIQSVKHAQLLLDYHVDNEVHLRPWQPEPLDEYLTLEYWVSMCELSEQSFKDGKEYRFVALDFERNEIIGVINYTGLAKGAFQACFLGYSISKAFENKGYMTEILEVTNDYILEVLGFNRIMANYMPHNHASARVLEKLGFEKEGYAKRYLKIAGKWEDHILTSKVASNRQ